MKIDLEMIQVQSGTGAKHLYVIYSKEKNQVLHDPMTDKPVNNRNPNLLREAAKVFKGEIMTAHEAFLKMTKIKS